jgi:hypothetical protein
MLGHGILTTYGDWLEGDDRGFRTYKHKLHVEGDYKHRPPTGRYKHRKARSQKLLKQPPVTLSRKVRKTVGIALIDRLHKSDAFVLAAAVGGQHVHLLAKLPAGDARHWFGLAKKHATFEMRQRWVGWRTLGPPSKDR